MTIKKKSDVAVIGAGFVGLAHAAYLSKFYRTHLIDRDQKKIVKLSSGTVEIASGDALLNQQAAESVRLRKLVPSSDFDAISVCDIIFVCVGLDFEEHNNSYDNLCSLAQTISKYKADDALVVFETTLPPGSCEQFVIPNLLKNNIGMDDLKFVYSYERVMPGAEYLKSISKLGKVFGVLNDASRTAYEMHLSLTGQLDEAACLRSIRSAELAKVLENSYRFVGIALVGEYVNIARTLQVDLCEILDAIRGRDTHSNIRFPGLSPGGYCLTKDPAFIAESFKLGQLDGCDLAILEASQRVSKLMNQGILDYVVSRLSKSSETLFLGISYLKNVGDTRGSSSLWLLKRLNGSGFQLKWHDAFVEPEECDFVEYFDSQRSERTLFSQIVLCVSHSEYTLNWIVRHLKESCMILDVNSCLDDRSVDELRNLGHKVERYGDFL